MHINVLFTPLCLLGLAAACPLQQASYEIGVGKSKITDGAHKPILQGFADPSQESTGVHDEIFARAFAIKGGTNALTVIVVMDNWAGTDKIKREVIERFDRNELQEENFLLTATHSHAAPGGYSDWKLYEHTPGGFDKHNFECIVTGVISAINAAFDSMAPGNIYINERAVASPGRQRSAGAYNANPSSERDNYPFNVDNTMLLLKLTHVGCVEHTIGVINWYAIHPTSLGQDYKKVSGDSKGYAEYLLEQEFGDTIVAAFANSNAGDVSANVRHGRPTGKSDAEVVAFMESDGATQYEAALGLLDTATTQLTSGLDYVYTRVDMSFTPIESTLSERTWPGSLGLCFAAGSTEDGVPRFEVLGTTFDSFNLREGITVDNISFLETAGNTLLTEAMELTFGSDGATLPNVDVEGHLPKPLLLSTGIYDPPLTPNVVPLQVIKIGQLAIVAVPGEPTTMAGRRIKQTVLNELSGISYVAIAAYSNEYASYITTKEEYDQQHYEGASTLFGPYTLMAYQQEYSKLANALNTGANVPMGPSKSPPSVPDMYRVTIRNLCNSNVEVKFFNDNDWLMWVALDGVHTIPGKSDYAYIAPTTGRKRMKMLSNGHVVRGIVDDHLVVISTNCGIAKAGQYTPYHQVNF